MAKSTSTAFEPFHAPQGFHIVLSFAVSAFFSLWCHYILWGTIPFWYELTIGGFYWLIVHAWSVWVAQTHQGGLLKFSTFVFLTAFVYAGLYLVDFRKQELTFMFLARHDFVFVTFFVGAMTLYFWQSNLNSRARLFYLTKNEPEGTALWELVRNYQLDADFSRQNYAALISSLITLSVVMTLLCAVFVDARGAWIVYPTAAFVLFSLWIGSLLRIYRREMEALMYGHRLRIVQKIRTQFWSAVLIAVAAVMGWAFTNGFDPVVDWAKIQQNELQRNPIPAPAPQNPDAELVNEYDPRGSTSLILYLLIVELIKVKSLYQFVFGAGQALIWSIPLIVVWVLVWPLIKLLRSGVRLNRDIGKIWGRLLVNQILDAFALLLSLIVGKKVKPKKIPLQFTEAQVWVEKILHAATVQKARELSKTLSAFLNVLEWAKDYCGKSAAYRHAETTSEYLHRLTLYVPQERESLELIGGFLEVELYSETGNDESRRLEFHAAVDKIVALTKEPPRA